MTVAPEIIYITSILGAIGIFLTMLCDSERLCKVGVGLIFLSIFFGFCLLCCAGIISEVISNISNAPLVFVKHIIRDRVFPIFSIIGLVFVVGGTYNKLAGKESNEFTRRFYFVGWFCFIVGMLGFWIMGGAI